MTNFFYDDSPLSRQKAGNDTVSSLDKFGRTKLIKNLAHKIVESVSDNGSLVVSIEGPWGFGKTSAKNMLVESLNEFWSKEMQEFHDSEGSQGVYPRLVNVEFDPWLFSGCNDVVVLMFSSIRNAIDEYLAKESEEKASTVSKIKSAGKAIGVISNLDKTGTLKTISEGLQRVSDSLDPASKNTKPLIQARDELIRQLRMLPKNYAIIVYIDEIDRLDDKDIAALFKALKSVGNLPHIVYVPVFDRQIVASALDNVSQPGRGYEYLEKIVQIPIVLPEIPTDVVWADFKKEVDSLFADDYKTTRQNHSACNLFKLNKHMFEKLESSLLDSMKCDLIPSKQPVEVKSRPVRFYMHHKDYTPDKREELIKSIVNYQENKIEKDNFSFTEYNVDNICNFIICNDNRQLDFISHNKKNLTNYITKNKKQRFDFILNIKDDLAAYFKDDADSRRYFIKANKSEIVDFSTRNVDFLKDYTKTHSDAVANYFCDDFDVLRGYIVRHADQVKAFIYDEFLRNNIRGAVDMPDSAVTYFIENKRSLQKYIIRNVDMIAECLVDVSTGIASLSYISEKEKFNKFIDANSDTLVELATDNQNILSNFISTKEGNINLNEHFFENYIEKCDKINGMDGVLKSYIEENAASVSKQVTMELETELDQSITKLEDKSSKRQLLESCVRPFVSSYRDMHRIINAFRIPALQLKDTVNLAELLYITAIKLYDHDFYDWIYQHRDDLVSKQPMLSGRPRDHDQYVIGELDGLPSQNQRPSDGVADRRRIALSILFPEYQKMHFNAGNDCDDVAFVIDGSDSGISNESLFKKIFSAVD